MKNNFFKLYVSFVSETFKNTVEDTAFKQRVDMVYHYLEKDDINSLKELLSDWKNKKSYARFQEEFGLTKDKTEFEKTTTSHPVFLYAKSVEAMDILKEHGCTTKHTEYGKLLYTKKLNENREDLFIKAFESGVGYRNVAAMLNYIISQKEENKIEQTLVDKVLNSSVFKERVSLNREYKIELSKYRTETEKYVTSQLIEKNCLDTQSLLWLSDEFKSIDLFKQAIYSKESIPEVEAWLEDSKYSLERDNKLEEYTQVLQEKKIELEKDNLKSKIKTRRKPTGEKKDEPAFKV